MRKKDYLPSSQFTTRVVVVAFFLLVAFGLYKGIPAIVRGFANAHKKALAKITVKDLVEKDSNKNGIADWEESLWGLDPAKNGDSNKEFILAKRKSLNQSADGSSPEDITTNDQMARDFFVLITTLRDSGNLNQGSIDSISKEIGKKITIEPITDIYTRSGLSLVRTNTATIHTYYSDFKKINDKYKDKDMGNELTFIAQGIKNDDQQALDVTDSVAEAYRSFAKDLSLIKVPDSLADTHLSIINNSEKVGQSIKKMELSLTDQITGLNAILGYKKYNDNLITSLGDLQTFFQRNGIIK